ncbi:MAG TPA: P-loop NTPase [Chthoniobacter sp.]|jgi:flagellar biosynthesis protein FlhG
MSTPTQSFTEPSTESTPDGVSEAIEPSELQFLERTFADYLAERPSDDDRLKAWRRDLTLWVHQRIFFFRDSVDEVHAELNATFRRTKIIAVTSGKGGVGKTTFSVNLAIACAQLGRKVLLFDADFGMANVHVYAGVSPKLTLLDFIDGRASIEEVTMPGPGGIQIICGASGVARLSNLGTFALESLSGQLLRFAADFDVLIIDTAAGISPSVMHFLGLAQETIVLATPALASTLDAYGVIKLVHEKRISTHLHLLVNQSGDDEEAGRVRERIAGCADRYLNVSVRSLGFLDEDRAFERSTQDRQPLMLHDPENANVKRMASIAAQFLEEEKPDRAAAVESNCAAA